MNTRRVKSLANYLSMEITPRIINRTLSLPEAMYSLILAIEFLLQRTLPKDAFENEFEQAKDLAIMINDTVNQYIKQVDGTSLAKIMLSMTIMAEAIMEGEMGLDEDT